MNTPLQTSLGCLLATHDNNGTQVRLTVTQSYMSSEQAAGLVVQFDGVQQKQIIINSIEKEKDQIERAYIVKAVHRYCMNELQSLLSPEDFSKYARVVNKELADMIRGTVKEPTSASKILSKI
jgi:hypothetical protein